MAYKEVTIYTDAKTGETKADWTKKPSYYHQASKFLPTNKTAKSQYTSTARQISSSIQGRRSQEVEDVEETSIRRNAVQAIAETPQTTQRGGPNPPTTTSQHVGGVPMMRTSASMARARHKCEQDDLVGLGSQFDVEYPVEWLHFEDWVFVDRE
ncbi:hypothetical protein PMZ80_005366 [Knufia obscura]|uniref:Uncharacterized protein n=1 Tax=Knufia obscura TaxID=1635080 RepID=A0ABR0RRC7_9EURO|nr:hypothetical protein PMZ80_005366 [Knufia obscura]